MSSPKLIYRVSEYSHPKGVVTMINIDEVISPNTKVIRTTEGQLTFDVIKEYFYVNPVHLMISWWVIMF